MRGIGIQLTDYIPTVAVERDEHGRITRGLVVGSTLHQNQALLLSLHPGEMKDNPSVGVGISDMLMDSDPLYWRGAIRNQLVRDGQNVQSIVITSDSVDIEARY
jgi:hypothetical protein